MIDFYQTSGNELFPIAARKCFKSHPLIQEPVPLSRTALPRIGR